MGANADAPSTRSLRVEVRKPAAISCSKRCLVKHNQAGAAVSRLFRLVLLTLSVMFVLEACSSARNRVVVEEESDGYEVFVVEDPNGIRRLRFARDGIDQSAVVLGDPAQLIFAYTKGLVSALALRPEAKRILIIGLGGGTMPMFIRAHLPESQIDVVEIDAVVAKVARQSLGFREDEALHVHIADGAEFIAQSEGQVWDLIMLDAYGADFIPPHLVTRGFYEMVRQRLAPDGVVAANLWSEYASPLYPSILRTLEAVFEDVQVVAPERSESRIALAFRQAQGLTTPQFVGLARDLRRQWSLRFDLPRMVQQGHSLPGQLPPGGRILE